MAHGWRRSRRCWQRSPKPRMPTRIRVAMITGFACTTAEVSAMNMSPMGVNHAVAQAEALDTRLPKSPPCWPTARRMGAPWR